MHKLMTGLMAMALGAWAMAAAQAARASDWPQFMRDSAHTGDAADEALTLPLGLVAQVKLDDAAMTSPAVVGGLAYVVDQMGTAYCIEPKAGRIVWKVSPDGEKAMGSNTSSPCVAKGRVYYGTTAGTFHILDAKDGKVVKTINIGWPIVSAPTFANDALYFQALDSVIRCLDLDGNEKWKWEHYKQYKEPTPNKAREFDKCINRPHYGGSDVVVSGTRVVTSVEWDLLCLEDKGSSAAIVWCQRCPWFPDALTLSSSLSGDYLYTVGGNPDGALLLRRFSFKDGTTSKEDSLDAYSFWITPAVRGSMVAASKQHASFLYDWEAKKVVARFQDIPGISSYTLAKGHCVMTTFNGELLAFEIAPGAGAKPFRVKLPSGKGIGSAPVLSGGCVYFGCDDGYLYAFGPGGALPPKADEKPAVHEPKSRVQPATGKPYGWVTADGGSQAGTNFADDPALKPPFRLRWASRTFGHFKAPCVATADGDIITGTCQRMVTCQEQSTGRMRWRLRLAPDGEELFSSAGLLAVDGKVYVPCPRFAGDNTNIPAKPGKIFCLDQKTGAIAWSAEIASKYVWVRTSPVLADGKVAWSGARKGSPPTSVIQAWDAVTGQPAWEVPIAGLAVYSFGVTDGKVFYFSAATQFSGGRQVGPHETLAIEAATGKVLWRTDQAASGLHLALKDDRLYLYDSALTCLSAKDGSILWGKGGYMPDAKWISLGSDYIAMRACGGDAVKFRLADGTAYPGLQKGGQLGGDGHACGPVSLTPNLAVSVTRDGLHVRDTKTGALLWQSLGFMPTACHSPSIANGRVFWPSTGSAMLYCWEPDEKK